MTSACIIVAAGHGRRFGGLIPKQYRELGGVTVLRHMATAFLAHPEVDHLRVVINPDDVELYEAAVAGLELAPPVLAPPVLAPPVLAPPVLGGETRQDSVRRGRERLAEAAPDRVLIHDGVRPFVAATTISAVLDAQGAALACVSVPDTLKRARDGVVEATIDRTGVWGGRTPQGFGFAEILAAHRAAVVDSALADLTDDTQLAERRRGMSVAVVEGARGRFQDHHRARPGPGGTAARAAAMKRPLL